MNARGNVKELAIIQGECGTGKSRVHIEEPDEQLIHKGDWYWVLGKNQNDEDTNYFMCITEIGSNYAEFQGPSDDHYNGTYVKRVHFDEFDDKCKKENNPKQLRMYIYSNNSIGDIITEDDYQERVRTYHERERKLEQWKKENPDKDRNFDAPYELRRHVGNFSPNSWEKVSPDSVYYDDAMDKMEKEIKKYNEFAIIIQGLFDRSEMLHPHPPVQVWDADSFNQNVKLIFDQDRALNFAEEPDIKAYINECNKHLKKGSMTIGQEDVWKLKEGEKETNRLVNNWRYTSNNYPDRFRPYGNPGPGYIAEVKHITRKGDKCRYEWERQSSSYRWDLRDKVYKCKLTVKVEDLFCIDGYKKGDYLQFFNNPRTRANYLKWAPMLLAAEEYVNGNTELLRKGNKGELR